MIPTATSGMLKGPCLLVPRHVQAVRWKASAGLRMDARVHRPICSFNIQEAKPWVFTQMLSSRRHSACFGPNSTALSGCCGISYVACSFTRSNLPRASYWAYLLNLEVPPQTPDISFRVPSSALRPPHSGRRPRYCFCHSHHLHPLPAPVLLRRFHTCSSSSVHSKLSRSYYRTSP